MKIKFLVIIVFLTLSFGGQAQNFHAGIYGGLSASQISGDNLSGFKKAGLWGGPFVYYELNDWSSLQMEISYSGKGSRKNAKPSEGDYLSYKLRLHYIEIPVVYQFHVSNKFTLQAGPSFGYLLMVREFINDSESFERIDEFKKRDVALNLGFIYEMSDNFDFLFRYSNSILAVRPHQNGATNPFNYGQYNSVLYMGLTYNIN